MSTSLSKKLPPLAQLAFELEEDFSELQRLSEQIETMSIESEGGMNHARKLMGKFGECGTRIGEGVQSLAKLLDDSRGRAEKAAELVATRAVDMQKKQERSDKMFERFRSLVERVQELTSAVAELKKPVGTEYSAAEKEYLQKRLGELDPQLGELIEQTRLLKVEAHEARLASLEKNADSLAQSLQSARGKLGTFAASATTSPAHNPALN